MNSLGLAVSLYRGKSDFFCMTDDRSWILARTLKLGGLLGFMNRVRVFLLTRVYWKCFGLTLEILLLTRCVTPSKRSISLPAYCTTNVKSCRSSFLPLTSTSRLQISLIIAPFSCNCGHILLSSSFAIFVNRLVIVFSVFCTEYVMFICYVERSSRDVVSTISTSSTLVSWKARQCSELSYMRFMGEWIGYIGHA
jgi:hypothetical protein